MLDEGAGPEITTWPMLLAGLGIGALASQLGAVTVSALPDEQDATRRLNAALLHAGATPQVVARDAQRLIVIAGTNTSRISGMYLLS